MKASELRIGNLIQYSDDGTEFQVEQIYSDGLDVKNDNEETYIEIEYFEGIPLTEEWLLKLGFTRKNGYGFVHKHLEGNLIPCENTEHCVSKIFVYKYHSITIHFEYIHTLQNFYFASTKKELTFKSE